jgi:phosphoribosylaminoimidazole-succinocarboxamide synthase
MGLVEGQLTLIDEIHTPDSSRYWLADSLQPGQEEPENFDKEFLRKWYAAQGYRGRRSSTHHAPTILWRWSPVRYISTYERLTGESFIPGEQPIVERIEKNLMSRRKGAKVAKAQRLKKV